MLKPINSVSKLLLVASLFGAVAVPVTVQATPPAAVEQSANTATGVVLDEMGDPYIGASVRVASDPSKGASTNLDGEFSIAGVKPGTKLLITAVGYKNLEAVWNGSPLNLQLQQDTQILDEVVVTAMGITREEKTLTYAVQTIKSDEVTRIKDNNFINSLQGKSAGLTITPNNSGAGGGASKIILRGSTSILGTNQPLIVLDGVPMQNGMQTQASVEGLINGGGGSGDDLLSTINPEDVESMTILKGPNAAALYGSAANNGVIIINTKSGAEGTVKVDISSTTSIETIANYPQTQQVYGLTSDLLTSGIQLGAWGPKIGTRDADELALKPYMMNSARNPIRDFFKTGITLNNGITLSGGTEKSRTYFSYNNTYQDGIIRNNKFTRNNVMLKETFSLFDKRVNISTSLNWIHQKTNNPPNTGKTLSALHAVYRMPADVDMRYFKNHYQHAGTYNDEIVSNTQTGNPKLLGQPVQTWDWYDKSLNNPYWVTDMYNKENKRDRILGNITLDVKLWKNLKYQTRFSVDMVMNSYVNEQYAGMYEAGWLSLGGQYGSGSSRSSDIYNDHMLTWNDRFADKFDVSAAVGTSFTRHWDRSQSISTNIDTCGIPNAFVPQNSKFERPDGSVRGGSATSASDSWNYKNWSTAVFATASIGLFDKVYIDGSYRVEWAQAFQQFTQNSGYKSFDYYSVGANVLVHKFLPESTRDWLGQLKWRGSYSVVGNPIPNQLFARQSIDFGTGVVGARPPLFENPQPETTTSFETGLDVWMFNNSFNFDVTYYNSTLKNQFMNVTTANGESRPVNTGKIRNYGVEFSAGYRWAINRDWTWQSNFNFAWNDNKILETYDPGDNREYTVEMGNNAFKIKYIKDKKYGDIYVNSIERDANGYYKMTSNNPLTARPTMQSDYSTYVGNTTSPYTLGWNNTISWKNLTLYFLIDGRIGGKVMSLTEAEMDLYGLSQRSADARLAAENNPELQAYDESGKMVPLMYLPDGSGRKISVENYYTTIGMAPTEEHVYNATSFRMRDISLSYLFPDLLGKGKGLTAQFSVKNAFFIYKDAPVDPDISLSAANGLSGIDCYGLPTLRSYAITLKLNF